MSMSLGTYSSSLPFFIHTHIYTHPYAISYTLFTFNLVCTSALLSRFYSTFICNWCFSMDRCVIVLVVLLVGSGYGFEERSDSILKEMGRVTGVVLRDCWTRASGTTNQVELVALMIRCLQRRTLLALGRVFNSDVVPLTDTVQLVRFWSGSKDNHNLSLTERSGNNSADFLHDVFDIMSNVFKTHTIRINIENDVSQGRIRRKHGVMPILMFGLVGLGMILIPMGFQFLAVLGGKALLLAKMALMLTSIQGLKKVATSNIHYGLYHTPPSGPWYDRKTEEQYPENYYNQIIPNDLHTTYVKRISTM